MKTIYDPEDIAKHRTTILQIARQELYPESDYPVNLFPDLQEVLWDCFAQIVIRKPDNDRRQELAKALKDESRDTFKSIVKKVLGFENLLNAVPQKVVMLYRTSIKKFIYFQQTRNRLVTDEWEDIYQEVITRLIAGKIQRIREKFDFQYSDGIKKSTFASYLMVTVRNIYMDIVRERQVRPLTAGELRPIDDVLETYKNSEEDSQMLNRLVMDEEFRKFRSLLALHYRSRGKLELCLKLKCRLPVTRNDIHKCFPGHDHNDVDILSRNYKSMKDKGVFDTVVSVFNRNESRNNKSDTLRKWVSVKLDEITAHMNRTHPRDVYTAKNLLDFLTLYYERTSSESPKETEPGQVTGDRTRQEEIK